MLRARRHGPLFQVLLLSVLMSTAFLPREAAGQDPADMVREFAESASGFTLVGDVETGSLLENRQVIIPLELVTGSDYMIVGFCDPDCTDLDLAILDSEGNELDSDHLPDPQPLLLVSPETSGGYQVRLDMVACSAEPCVYAVGVFQGDVANSGLDLPGGSMDERLRSFREDLIAEGFSETGGGENGSLDQDQEMRFPISLREGIEYRVVGVCDNDCENLDLVLLDPEGREADSDLMADAFPIVELTPQTSGEYRLAVNMVTCTLEPCAFRVAIFGKGPGMAPGGVIVTGEILSESTHQGRLEEGDGMFREGEYFDEYTVRAEAGQRIIADLRSSDFDTFLILEAPNGDAERNDDYADDTMHSHIEWLVEEGGDFAILVSSFSAGLTGNYVLQVAVVEGS